MAAAPARKRAKVGGDRRTANRFANLAGGDDTTSATAEAAPVADAGGLMAGIAAATAEQGHRIIQIPVTETAPHPYNDPARCVPKPGEPKWEELVNGVRINGVQLPVLAVTRKAFLSSRPVLGDQIPADARWVIIYGHRRRAAALAVDAATIPAVVDDTIMAADGDLDAMATENLGRQDLSDLAEAELFARYSELGLSQRAIADRLGVDQATVSRRLALLLLAPEVQDAVAAGEFSSADAAILAGALPFGPKRRWQKSPDPSQESATRRTDQTVAYRLVIDRGMSASRAVDRIRAERQARDAAAAQDIEIIADPREQFGPTFYDHRVFEGDDYDDVVAAIDPDIGTLVLYALTPPPKAVAAPKAEVATDIDDTAGAAAGDTTLNDNADTPPPVDVNKQARAASLTARRQSCGNLASAVPSRTDLAAILIDQYVTGIAADGFSTQADALVAKWGTDASPHGDKARQAAAWMRAVAAGEIHTSALTVEWDAPAVAHLRQLMKRVGYQPTRWEQVQIDAALER